MKRVKKDVAHKVKRSTIKTSTTSTRRFNVQEKPNDPSDNYISHEPHNHLAASQNEPTSASKNSNCIQVQSTQVSPEAIAKNIVTEGIDDVVVPSVKHDICKRCGVCEPRRGSGYRNNFLACKACAVKWHFECLPIKFEVLFYARQRYKCDLCRCCCFCKTKRTDKTAAGQLVMCCVCVKVYHLDCHSPRVIPDKMDDMKWKCYACDPSHNPTESDDIAVPLFQRLRKSTAACKEQITSNQTAKNPLSKNKEVLTKSYISPTKAPMNDDNRLPKNDNEKLKEGSDKNVPLSKLNIVPEMKASISLNSTDDKENSENQQPIATGLAAKKKIFDWSIDEVYDYVKQNYPQYADVFRNQKIDGSALMLLTRADIIESFGLSFGKALHVYDTVFSLQNSTNDINIG